MSIFEYAGGETYMRLVLIPLQRLLGGYLELQARYYGGICRITIVTFYGVFSVKQLVWFFFRSFLRPRKEQTQSSSTQWTQFLLLFNVKLSGRGVIQSGGRQSSRCLRIHIHTLSLLLSQRDRFKPLLSQDYYTPYLQFCRYCLPGNKKKLCSADPTSYCDNSTVAVIRKSTHTNKTTTASTTTKCRFVWGLVVCHS
jgi:hypothetical protein